MLSGGSRISAHSSNFNTETSLFLPSVDGQTEPRTNLNISAFGKRPSVPKPWQTSRLARCTHDRFSAARLPVSAQLYANMRPDLSSYSLLQQHHRG